MNIILFFAGLFLVTFIIGREIERLRIPWIFSSLLVGLGLAVYNPFAEITSSSSFALFAEMGMYFLLFIIGFELNMDMIVKSSKFFVKTTFVIISLETLFGTLLIHYLFDTSWIVSVLVGSSFATVGEAVLLPILEEFNLVKTKLGQTILGIGSLDDIFEVITIIFASVLIGRTTGHSHISIWGNILILITLFGILFVLISFRDEITRFKYKDISSFFLFTLFIMFSFIGVGMFAESAALGAILAGIALRKMIDEDRLKFIESEIKTMAYGFFAPIFFLSVGLDTDIHYLIKYPFFILLIMVMTNTTKILSSYIMARKRLGTRKSILLGISLSVKFSTSIVIIKILFENSIIQSDLYSVLIGTTIVFKFVLPMLLGYLITRWKIMPKKTKV